MTTTLRNFRVADIEYASWQKSAARLGMDVSGLIRAAVSFALSYEGNFAAAVARVEAKPDPKPERKAKKT